MEPAPVLAVESLTTKPGDDGTPILSGVSLSVAAGERVVLTGPSGSGKSTLLRCMVMLEPALEGRVLLEGDTVGPERVRELRRRVGYLPQRPVAIADTVAENLAFAAGENPDVLDEDSREDLLERLGVAGVGRNRRFADLSGGEQQRIALVRTLTVQPQVLLLDEPTASLDPENVDAVLELIDGWADAGPDRALLWVSHQAQEVDELGTRRVTVAGLSAASTPAPDPPSSAGRQ